MYDVKLIAYFLAFMQNSNFKVTQSRFKFKQPMPHNWNVSLVRSVHRSSIIVITAPIVLLIVWICNVWMCPDHHTVWSIAINSPKLKQFLVEWRATTCIFTATIPGLHQPLLIPFVRIYNDYSTSIIIWLVSREHCTIVSLRFPMHYSITSSTCFVCKSLPASLIWTATSLLNKLEVEHSSAAI